VVFIQMLFFFVFVTTTWINHHHFFFFSLKRIFEKNKYGQERYMDE